MSESKTVFKSLENLENLETRKSLELEVGKLRGDTSLQIKFQSLTILLL
jgi:hypothetical protein